MANNPANTTNIPAKTEIIAAANKAYQFLKENQSYSSTEHYSLLNSLYSRAITLVDNYDDALFVAVNTPTYNTIASSIDQTISSCRYSFGITYAETMAKIAAQEAAARAAEEARKAEEARRVEEAQKAAQSTQNPQLPQPKSSTPGSIKTATATTSSTPASKTTTETTPDSNASPSVTAETTETAETGDSLATGTIAPDAEPVEIPKTGAAEGVSVFFAVLVSLLVAAIATGLYFLYDRRHKKPRRR